MAYFLTNNSFPDFTIIFNNGSVIPLSSDFTFYIPELHISFLNNLPSTASFYTTKCYTIIEALLISSSTSNKFLMATDSLSCLQVLISNVFKLLPSSLIIKIRFLLYNLTKLSHTVQFLWIPIHIGIFGNETADSLAKSTASICCPSFSHILWSDFCLMLKKCVNKLWLNYWLNLLLNFVTCTEISYYQPFSSLNFITQIYPVKTFIFFIVFILGILL